MAFDRNKYKPAATADLKSKEEEVNDKIFSGGMNFIKFLSVKTGTNKLRIFPAHTGTKGNIWIQPKTTSWLPQEIEEKDEDGKKSKKIARRPIFNSRIHGGTRKDLVEEYITFVINQQKEKFGDDKEGLEKAIKPILNWKVGIKPQTTWVAYVKRVLMDGTAEYGRFEFTIGTKNQLNAIAATEDEDEAITTDPFTHPDDGKMVKLVYDPEKKGGDKYAATIMYKTDAPLSDEELQDFENDKIRSLEELYVNSFQRSDFGKQLTGLEIFDNENGYEAFTHDDWLDIVEEIDKYYPEDDEEEDQDEDSGEDNEEDEDSTEQEDETSEDKNEDEDEDEEEPPFEDDKEEEEKPKEDKKTSSKKNTSKKGKSRMELMKEKYKKDPKK